MADDETSKDQKPPANLHEEEEASDSWKKLEEAFNNLTSMVEGASSYKFTSEDYMSLYETVYKACSGPESNASQRFYDGYKRSFEDYIDSKILPSLESLKGEDLLRELVKLWSNYKTVTRWFFRFLHYLERYYIPKNRLPTLVQTSYLCFYNKVYGKLNDQVRDVVLTSINRERSGEGGEGKMIDKEVMRDVLDIYDQMGEGSMKYYNADFEEAMLADASEFYCSLMKGSEEMSRELLLAGADKEEDYMDKVRGWIEREKSTGFFSCLKKQSQVKLIEVVEHVLLTKQHSQS